MKIIDLPMSYGAKKMDESAGFGRYAWAVYLPKDFVSNEHHLQHFYAQAWLDDEAHVRRGRVILCVSPACTANDEDIEDALNGILADILGQRG